MSYMSDRIAGRVHVWSSNRKLIREGWEAFAPDTRKANDPATILARKLFYKDLIASHKRNQEIVTNFRL